MRRLGIGLTLAVLAGACGGSPQGSSPTGPTPTAPPPPNQISRTIYTATSSPVLARVVDSDGTEVVYVGTKTPDGLPATLSAAVVHAESETERIVITYDEQGRPMRLLGANGEQALFDWTGGSPSITLVAPDGTRFPEGSQFSPEDASALQALRAGSASFGISSSSQSVHPATALELPTCQQLDAFLTSVCFSSVGVALELTKICGGIATVPIPAAQLARLCALGAGGLVIVCTYWTGLPPTAPPGTGPPPGSPGPGSASCEWLTDPSVPDPIKDVFGFHSISGRVIDARTRSPVPRAEVVAGPSGRSAFTDNNGNYSLSLVPDGSVRLDVHAAGYRSDTQLDSQRFVHDSDRVIDFALVALDNIVSVSGIAVSPAGEGIAEETTFTFAAVGAISVNRGELHYRYDFEGDSEFAIGNPVTHVFREPGTFRVTLTVTDVQNFTATATVSVVVQPSRSSSVTGIGVSPAGGGIAGETTFTFTALGASAGNTFGFVYDFGDGTPVATGNPVSHVFNDAGTYVVRLAVIDSTGNSSTVSVSVVVQPPSPDPPNPPNPPNPPDTVRTLNLTGTFSGPILVTFQSCTRTHLETGTVSLTLTVNGSSVQGTANVHVTSTVTAVDCPGGGPQVGHVQVLDYDGVSVTGTTGSVIFNATATATETGADGGILTTTRGFAFTGAFNGNTVSGTVTETFQNVSSSDRGTGSATFPLTLR